MKKPTPEKPSEDVVSNVPEPLSYRELATELLAGHKLPADALAHKFAMHLTPDDLERTIVLLQHGLTSQFWKLLRDVTVSRIAAELRTGVMHSDASTRLQAMDRARCRLDLLVEPMVHLHVCKSQLAKPKE